MDLRSLLLLLCATHSFPIEDHQTPGSAEMMNDSLIFEGSAEMMNDSLIFEGSSRSLPQDHDIDGSPVMTEKTPIPKVIYNSFPMVEPLYFYQDARWHVIHSGHRVPFLNTTDEDYDIDDWEEKLNGTSSDWHVVHRRWFADLSHLRSSWVTKFLPSVYIVVLLVALPLNTMALVIFLVKVKVEKPAVVYLLNLAMADVLFVATLPFQIVYRLSGSNWLMGEGMCRLTTAAFYTNMHGPILLITMISVDRLLGVVYPVRTLSWRTVRRAWLACCFIWIVSVASAAPFLAMPQTQPIPQLNVTTCHDVQNDEVIHKFRVFHYFPFYFSLLYFLPLIITASCYVGIIRSLSVQSIKGTPRKRSRAILLSVVVLSTFVLCFGPTNAILVAHFLHVYKGSGNFLYVVYILSVGMSSVSCCVDPLIYFYASSQWQRHVYNLLGCQRESPSPVKQHELLIRNHAATPRGIPPNETPETSSH